MSADDMAKIGRLCLNGGSYNGKQIVVAVASYFKPTVFDRVDFIREYIEPLITE